MPVCDDREGRTRRLERSCLREMQRGDAMSSNLFDAIDRHDLALLDALLQAGADPNVEPPSQPSWVPLKLAVSELDDGGPTGAVELLLRHGALPDGGGDPGGNTALIQA